jgi:hypothetical protein
MTTKQSQISYQSYSSSPCLDRLIARFGDCLEKLTAIDKLDLIAILALWQSADSDCVKDENPPILLNEYLAADQDLQSATSYELDEALEILGNCSDADCLALLVTLSCQLRDGVFAE